MVLTPLGVYRRVYSERQKQHTSNKTGPVFYVPRVPVPLYPKSRATDGAAKAASFSLRFLLQY